MRLRLPESFWPASLDARPFASTAAANAALAVVGLLTGMLAARLLGAEGRGELAAAQAWPLFLANLGSFGVTDAIAYFGARSPVRARAVLATGLMLTVPFVLVALAAGAWLLPRVLSDQTMDVRQVATVSLLLVPLLILSTAPSHALRGVGRYRAWNVLRLVAPLAWLMTLVAVRGTDHATVPTLAVAFIGATALAALVTHLHAWWTLAGPAAPEGALVRPMLAYSAPTMAATIPRWLNLRLDQLIVIALLDARALGLYGVAVAWSAAAHPLAEVVAHNAVPALAGTKDTWQRARLVYRTGAVAAIGTSVLLLAATPILLPLIFGAEFRPAIPVALVMVFAGAVEAINSVGAECLRGVGRPRAVPVAECVGLAVTLVALPLLVLMAGIVGAAAASLLTYTAILVAQRRLMRAPREDGPLEFAAPLPSKLDPVS
jgi:O-antigen/teichoic acid export membrane protein